MHEAVKEARMRAGMKSTEGNSSRRKRGGGRGRERQVCDTRQGNRMKASKVEGNSLKMRGA